MGRGGNRGLDRHPPRTAPQRKAANEQFRLAHEAWKERAWIWIGGLSVVLVFALTLVTLIWREEQFKLVVPFLTAVVGYIAGINPAKKGKAEKGDD